MRQETSKGYRKLIVFNKAEDLAYKIYIVTRNFPREEIYGLTSQMRRASVSVPANIVEGYARHTTKEQIQFCYNARGSLTELEFFIEFARQLDYLTEEDYMNLESLRLEVGRLLNGFMKVLA